MAKHILLYTLGLILLNPFFSFALDSRFDITQYVHTIWSKENHFPAGSGRAIAQTPDGFLWFGTEEGLIRFDGLHFEVFNQNNTPALLHQQINALCVDRAGGVWIGTDAGLNLMRSGTVTSELLSMRILSLHENENRIWVGTSQGVYIIDAHSRKAKAIPGLEKERVKAMLIRPENALIGTSERLISIDFSQAWKQHSIPFFDGTHITALVMNTKGEILIGTADRGLFQMSSALDPRQVDYGVPWGTISWLHQDRNQNLWIGTFGAGLVRLTAQGAIQLFGKEQGLSSSLVNSIFEDSEHGLWVGGSAAIDQFKNPLIVPFGRPEGIADDSILSTYADSRGTLWIGTERSVYLFDKGTFKRIPAPPLNLVHSIVHFLDQDLWLGTADGLYKWNVATNDWNRFDVNTGLPSNHIHVLFADNSTLSTSLWIGTWKGVVHYDGHTFHRAMLNNQFYNEAVFSIASNRSGELLFGTATGEVLKEKEGHLTPFLNLEGIILSMYEDINGVVWITSSSGLYSWNRGHVKRWTVRDGLPTNTIYSIVDDHEDQFWFSHNGGIFSIPKKQFDTGKKLSPVTYGIDDGMRAPECNGMFQPAAARTPDGRIWFPTPKGLVFTYPNEARRSGPAAPLKIISYSVNRGQNIAATQSMSIGPGVEELDIHFNAPTFTHPRKLQFRYMLGGFETRWNTTSLHRTAHYTNLPAGHYTLVIQRSDYNGQWIGPHAKIEIAIQPFWYQRPIFAVLAILIAAATLICAHQYYIRRLRRLNARLEEIINNRTMALEATVRRTAILEERDRLANELHDVLAQGLAGIVLTIEGALTDPGGDMRQAEPSIRFACDQARHCLEETRRAVRELRPAVLEGTGDLFKVVSQMADSYRAMTRARITCLGNNGVIPLSPQQELHVLRVTQEALSNAVRHSAADRIVIELQRHASNLQLSITDNGTGFHTEPPYGKVITGFGLNGMKTRATSIGGTLEISSTPGLGTVVKLIVPLLA